MMLLLAWLVDTFDSAQGRKSSAGAQVDVLDVPLHERAAQRWACGLVSWWTAVMEQLRGWRPRAFREIRVRRGLTQTDLAERMRLARPTVTRWERGRVPSLQLLPRLTAGLDFSLCEVSEVSELRAARLAVGWSLADLARAAGRPVRTLRGLDDGRVVPDEWYRAHRFDALLQLIEAETDRLAHPVFDPPESPMPWPAAAALRLARRANGWSQTDLATRVGVSMNTVSRWETGIQHPSPLARARLTALLGIDDAE